MRPASTELSTDSASARRHIVDVAIAWMAPPGLNPQTDLLARLAAYAQTGILSELCLAWHGMAWHQERLAMERAAHVDLSGLTALVLKFQAAHLRRARPSAVPCLPHVPPLLVASPTSIALPRGCVL
jgi:hypothetical protein